MFYFSNYTLSFKEIVSIFLSTCLSFFSLPILSNRRLSPSSCSLIRGKISVSNLCFISTLRFSISARILSNCLSICLICSLFAFLSQGLSQYKTCWIPLVRMKIDLQQLGLPDSFLYQYIQYPLLIRFVNLIPGRGD